MATWRRDRKALLLLLLLSFSFLVIISTVSTPCALFALLSMRYHHRSTDDGWSWNVNKRSFHLLHRFVHRYLGHPVDFACRCCFRSVFHLVSFEQTQANDKSERERGIREDRCSHCIPVAMYNTQTLIRFSANRIQTEGVFVLGWHNLYWWRRRAKRKFTLDKDNGKADCRTF